ncbi:protein toll [Osmia bicornis bicornis]|uniref:protein toll n=1 Tax=Osmia bicornis bicornis TaxID=1437191 RepID=UPI001EAEC4BE|nr:protein toll [Osmia bicornis bicornis]XP_046140973.1 protein toll [Osmia bicornis bicornis]
MIGSCWIIISVILATCNAFDILQCSPEWGCNCHNSYEGDVQLYCPTDEDSAFIVNVQPHEYIQIQCQNYPQWTDFRLFNLFPKDDMRAVYIRMCGLPTNSSLGEIASRFGTENVDKLLFQSFGNLSGNLTRRHLTGFPKLQRLILSSNGLTNLSSDVFVDVPHLIWLDLRENNVYLSPGIFNNTPELEVLELGNNMISQIEPGIFDPLTNLKLLNLWLNKFKEVKPDTFDKLVSLTSLDLNSNELTTLPENVFAKLENLEVLSLYNNNFTSLPEDLLRNNVKLKNINLSNNKRNMTLPRRFFANLTQLEVLKLKRSGLIAMPEDLFWGSTSLKNISLENNYLETLPKRIFEGLNRLLELDLGTNKLMSLPDEIFSYTTSLVYLNLEKNHLTSISANLFNNLKSLRILNMEQNQLETIEDRSFISLANLRIARFSKNQLKLASSFVDEYGRKSYFYDCKSLEELHLAHNNISEIFADWTINGVELRLLNLSYNQIPYILATDLQFISNDLKVDLTHNKIQDIYLGDAEELAKYQTSSRDVIIYVQNNPIVCGCALYDFLRYLEGKMHKNVQNYIHIIPGNLTCHGPDYINDTAVDQLHSESFICPKPEPCPEGCSCWIRQSDNAFLIDCSYKNLTSIPENIKTIPNYRLELNFMGNKLTKMPSLTELGLNNVSTSKLLLANNNLKDLSVDELPSNIEVLELHNNNFNRLGSDVLKFLSNSTMLKKLTLHGNPWTCDCDAKDFLNFIQTRVRVMIPHLSSIVCQDINVPMLKMTVTDLCPTDTMMIVGASLSIAIVGLIIGTLIALYYRYQREIKVWLYAHEWCLWLVTEDELDRDKLYDAFISYSHKDEDFVVNELVQTLESGPRPFKLCLHFRDWLAGEYIPTQIARSVEDSRRTIVVLSSNFIESVWGRMEFKAAHCQALSEGRARVILVLYGEIGPTDNLDPELKAYLNMNTYVKWGDPWFWDKLRYALPHPPELTKNTIKRKIFERHQPCIQISGEKKDLIYPINTPEALTTPPADSLKVFICNEKNEDKKDPEKISPVNSNAKLIITSDDITKHNFMNKIQCTTV